MFTSQIVLGTDLNDVTATLFPGRIPNHALISAYGDYNADKLIDIFILSDDGRCDLPAGVTQSQITGMDKQF